MSKVLLDQGFKDSMGLFEQAFSLEIAEFSTKYWNFNYALLNLEQLVDYHSFVQKIIKNVEIFASKEETRLDGLIESIIHTIESKFLNVFSTFVITTMENFWQSGNFIFDGKYIFNNSYT
jgi:hypothetical protein